MRGPKPKDPEVRARRNKAPTRADLPAPDSTELRKLKAPPLNAQLLGMKRGQGAVKPQVLRWWRVVWRSPMAPRWLESDVEVLYDIAQLRQQKQQSFEEGKPITSIETVIASQEGRLGLDVMSRRRLDWRIENTRPSDQPVPVVEESRAPVQADEAFDPRQVLRAVK